MDTQCKPAAAMFPYVNCGCKSRHPWIFHNTTMSQATKIFLKIFQYLDEPDKVLLVMVRF